MRAFSLFPLVVASIGLVGKGLFFFFLLPLLIPLLLPHHLRLDDRAGKT